MRFARYMISTLTIATTLIMPAHSAAADVSLSVTLVNSCVLSITSPGTLAATTNGETITSETSGGSPAMLTVVAIGLSPTIKFAAPTLQSPGGWSGSPVTAIRYTSTGGANQAYTTAASQVTAGALLDTFTVNGKVDTQLGFAAGQYAIHTIVTCQQ